MPNIFLNGDLVTKKRAKRKVVYIVCSSRIKGKGRIYECRIHNPNSHTTHMIPGSKLVKREVAK
jgi:hypothetical protein